MTQLLHINLYKVGFLSVSLNSTSFPVVANMSKHAAIKCHLNQTAGMVSGNDLKQTINLCAIKSYALPFYIGKLSVPIENNVQTDIVLVKSQAVTFETWFNAQYAISTKYVNK